MAPQRNLTKTALLLLLGSWSRRVESVLLRIGTLRALSNLDEVIEIYCRGVDRSKMTIC